jgi:hypothetical protein
MVNPEALKDFSSYPAIVRKVAELLADRDPVCVLLGERCAVATTWDRNILAIAKTVELEPREDGSLAYLGWEAGDTVGRPVVAGTIAVTTKDDEFPLSREHRRKVGGT